MAQYKIEINIKTIRSMDKTIQHFGNMFLSKIEEEFLVKDVKVQLFKARKKKYDERKNYAV